MTCAVFIVFFLCCQCSFVSRYLHSANSALCLTLLFYSSSLFLLELPYTHSQFKLLTPLFVVLSCMIIINNLSSSSSTCSRVNIPKSPSFLQSFSPQVIMNMTLCLSTELCCILAVFRHCGNSDLVIKMLTYVCLLCQSAILQQMI